MTRMFGKVCMEQINKTLLCKMKSEKVYKNKKWEEFTKVVYFQRLLFVIWFLKWEFLVTSVFFFQLRRHCSDSNVRGHARIPS